MKKYCGRCGAKLDKRTGLCPRCDGAQISGVRNRRKRTPLVISLALASSLAVLLFLAWMVPALRPGSPQVPGADPVAEGCPFDHQPGEPTVTLDIGTASAVTTVRCTACGEVIRHSTEKMDTFLDGEQFIFTPEQFMGRVLAALKPHAPNASRVTCREETAVVEGSAVQEDLLVYRLLYAEEVICDLCCYDKTDRIIRMDRKGSDQVWSVTFHVPYTREDSFAMAQNVFDAMMEACDPRLTGEEREAFVLRGTKWIEECSADGWTSFMAAKNGILYLMELVTAQDGNPYIYGSAYATMDLSKLNLSGASVSDAVEDPPAETPIFSTEEAEHLLSGTWVSRSIIFDVERELYRMNVEGSSEDRITMTFRDDHRAELNIEAFSLDSEFTPSLMAFWNGRPVQWDYLYDTGNTLYYLIGTPSIQMSAPYCYDFTSNSNKQLRVWLTDSVSVLLEKQ